jgi:hypothetical protein
MMLELVNVCNAARFKIAKTRTMYVYMFAGIWRCTYSPVRGVIRFLFYRSLADPAKSSHEHKTGEQIKLSDEILLALRIAQL